MKRIIEKTSILEEVVVNEFVETYITAIKPEYTGKYKETFIAELAKDITECFEDSDLEGFAQEYAKLAFFRLKKSAELYQLNKSCKDISALSEIEKKAKEYKKEYDFFTALAA